MAGLHGEATEEKGKPLHAASGRAGQEVLSLSNDLQFCFTTLQHGLTQVLNLKSKSKKKR
jgi:hypothetical protein